VTCPIWKTLAGALRASEASAQLAFEQANGSMRGIEWFNPSSTYNDFNLRSTGIFDLYAN
jgi:hypothetical protein